MRVEELPKGVLERAKFAFTTRRVPTHDMQTVVMPHVRPSAGDLVLATVDELGSHQRLELPNGRRARIFPGDTIVVCYGNRYAPDQFEALVPDDLSSCELVAGGGVAGREVCRHERMTMPTRIIPIGLVGDVAGQPLNLADYSVRIDGAAPKIPVVLVFGTSMNSGKTMTAGSLVRGFATAGARVGGVKATGTGSGGDLWFMKDMGAVHASDFIDIGLASTYMARSEYIEQGVFDLIDHAALAGCEIAVVEIADGLQHAETATLLQSSRLRERACGVVFAAYDALGAHRGVETLKANGHRVFAVSGQLTRSPLAVREAANSVSAAVISPIQIQSGMLNDTILTVVGEAGNNVIRPQELAGRIDLSGEGQGPGHLTGNVALGLPSPVNNGVCGHEHFDRDLDECDEGEIHEIADSMVVADGSLPLRVYR